MNEQTETNLSAFLLDRRRTRLLFARVPRAVEYFAATEADKAAIVLEIRTQCLDQGAAAEARQVISKAATTGALSNGKEK